MADILIRGMEMPKSGRILCINIFPDGKVTRQLDLSCEQIATAVPLPEGHGRMIDADALKKKRHWTDDFYETEYVEVEDIDTAPTIVPAEGGENE